MHSRKIWVVDDEETLLDLVASGLSVVVRGQYSTFLSVEDVRKELETNGAPHTVFIDARGPNGDVVGVSILETILDYSKENPEKGLLDRVVFMSSDEELLEKDKNRKELDYRRFATECKLEALDKGLLPSGRIYALDKLKMIPKLMSTVAALTIDEYNGVKGDHGELGAFVRDEIAPTPANQVVPPLSYALAFEIYSSRDVFRHLQLMSPNALVLPGAEKIGDFQKGFGKTTHGFAVFSVEDLEKFGGQGVLIAEKFDCHKMFSHLSNMAGLVIVDGKDVPGHLASIGVGNDVTVMVGGATFWDALMSLDQGASVTLDPNGKTLGLFKGHLPIPDIDKTKSRTIIELFRMAAEEKCWRTMKFMATVDSIAKAGQTIENEGAGIGLIRTEHLVFTDTPAREALCKILSSVGDCSDAYRTLTERQKMHMLDVFDSVAVREDKSGTFPVRVRLLDAPLDEIDLPEKVIEALAHCKDGTDLRGVKMGIAKPDLYRNQLNAIFAAYRESNAENVGIQLEIMVPSVSVVDDIREVMLWAREAAEAHGYARRDYRFGTMLETVEVIDKAGDIAGDIVLADGSVDRIDFASFGTNDLTEAVVGFSRGNNEKRNTYTENGHSFDPFVTLCDDVVRLVEKAAAQVYDRRPDFELCLCGGHATDLSSLERLGNIALKSISVPPTENYLYGLQADWCLYAFRANTKKSAAFVPYTNPGPK